MRYLEVHANVPTYLVSSGHCAGAATCSPAGILSMGMRNNWGRNAALVRSTRLVGGLPRQACMKIACALHSREAARQRLNAAGLVSILFPLDFYFSTGVILLPPRSG